MFKLLVHGHRKNSFVSLRSTDNRQYFNYIIRQVQMLAIQISDERIEFTIFQTFPLNHQFFYSVMSLLISYFVVLLQFEMEN